MSRFTQQIARAQQRYERHRKQREERKQGLSQGDWLKVDSPARILRRLERLGRSDVAAEVMAGAETAIPGAPRPNMLEAIVNDSQLRSIAFLYRMAAASRAVARVEVRTPFGGGAMAFT